MRSLASASNTRTLRIERPHPAQAEILRGTRRFNAIACGRRFGKSRLVQHRLLEPLLAGLPAAYMAPTYKLLAPVWRDFRRLLLPITTGVSVQERRIEVIGGGELDFWTLTGGDPGRGRKYARVAIDEAGLVPDLEPTWNEAIRPTLTDLTGGADLLGTPKGRNFFWTAFNLGSDPLEHDWTAFRFPTSANPFIPPGEVRAAQRQMPERAFRQEFLAEFLEDGGGVFQGVVAAIDPGRTASEPWEKGRAYGAGADLARVEDFTVLDVVDANLRQVHFERFNQISWERQVGRIHAVGKAYRAPTVMDTTGVGDPVYEAARKGGVSVVPYPFTHATKEALIDNLAMAIEGGKCRLMDIPVQTGELLAYQYDLSRTGKVTMNAPAGMHDDCVIGLALAAWGMAPANRRVFRLF